MRGRGRTHGKWRGDNKIRHWEKGTAKEQRINRDRQVGWASCGRDMKRNMFRFTSGGENSCVACQDRINLGQKWQVFYGSFWRWRLYYSESATSTWPSEDLAPHHLLVSQRIMRSTFLSACVSVCAVCVCMCVCEWENLQGDKQTKILLLFENVSWGSFDEQTLAPGRTLFLYFRAFCI